MGPKTTGQQFRDAWSSVTARERLSDYPAGAVGCTVAAVPGRRAHEVLATNLHRLVFEQGSSFEAVARSAGITPEQLQAICTGEFDPDLDLVARIAEAVNVTASELIAEPNYN